MTFNYMFPIRLTQLLFSIITVGLCGYVAHWYVSAASVASPGQVNILIFDGLWTFLISIYLIVSPVYFPRLSHKYAVLALDAVTALFWFAGFLALGVFLSKLGMCAGGVCHSARAGVVFASFLWALFMVTTVLAALHVWRTRHSSVSKPAAQQPVGPRATV